MYAAGGDGALKGAPTKRAGRQLDHDTAEAILTINGTDPSLFDKEIIEKVRYATGQVFSRSGMGRALEELRLRRKKLERRSRFSDPDDVAAWEAELQSYSPSMIVYADEAGINDEDIARTHGRGVGRVVMDVLPRRGKLRWSLMRRTPDPPFHLPTSPAVRARSPFLPPPLRHHGNTGIHCALTTRSLHRAGWCPLMRNHREGLQGCGRPRVP